MKRREKPRADKALGHVIISEKNKALESMRVDRLPFPYQNSRQMEKALSQPIGATWNTASGELDFVVFANNNNKTLIKVSPSERA